MKSLRTLRGFVQALAVGCVLTVLPGCSGDKTESKPVGGKGQQKANDKQDKEDKSAEKQIDAKEKRAQ